MRLKFILGLITFFVIAMLAGFIFLQGDYRQPNPTRVQIARKTFCEMLGGEMRDKYPGQPCGIAWCSYTCKFSK